MCASKKIFSTCWKNLLSKNYSIDNNRHRSCTALTFGPPATPAWNESLRNSLRKRVSLALPCWKLTRTIRYRPFCTASAICCMLSIDAQSDYDKNLDKYFVNKNMVRLNHSFLNLYVTSECMKLWNVNGKNSKIKLAKHAYKQIGRRLCLQRE